MFRSSDCCINQFLSISYEFVNAFDKGFELCGIFLDIPKGFEKALRNGLILSYIKFV